MSIKTKVMNVLNMYVKKSYWYNNIIFDNCSKFWQHSTFELDIINLGSTSALSAFDYTAFPSLKTANWAMSPQTLVADYQILRNYSSYLREGATVLIPLCPFSCFGGSNDFLQDKYYTILDIASIPHASFIRKQQVIDTKNNPLKYYPMIQVFTRNRLSNQLRNSEDDLVLDANRRLKSWQKEFGIIRFSDPISLVNKDSFQDSVALLHDMINYCTNRLFKPVLVMPPVSNALQKNIGPELKRRLVDDFVGGLTMEGCRFLDYFNDVRFSDEYFQDSFLLNKSGAKLLTSIVLKDLNLV